MNSFSLFLGLAFAFLCISGVFVRGEEGLEAVEVNNETAKNQTGPVFYTTEEILVYHFLPKFGQSKVIAGALTDLLVGIRNTGENSWNITHIQSSIVHPYDYTYHLENFTRREYGVVVGPNEQHTLSYTFVPNELLEPREYGLTTTVYFQQLGDIEGKNYTNLAYNGTVEVVENVSGVDSQLLFTVVGGAGLAGLVAYIIYTVFASLGKKTKRSSRKIEHGTVKEDVLDNDWLDGTLADLSKVSKKAAKLSKKTK